MWDRLREKLGILADAAKYDVSCASSGSKRANENKGLGHTAGMGICHAYTEDGRCVSLLKILLTNHCILDCAYCINRKSNNQQRAAFTVQEVVDLTIHFYRRNYIEGLFLSSGIFSSADDTMERLVLVAKKLRTEQNFHGYIHLKAIPGVSNDLLEQAGLYADRLSVNMEMPTEQSLRLLAPDKSKQDIIHPMRYLKQSIQEHREHQQRLKHTPLFAPAGQSTQLVIGATPETDWHILQLASGLYHNMQLKRVYYSGYVPVTNDHRLPAIGTAVPVIRENRLYQADWLLRFYGFRVQELLSADVPSLDLDIDPKLAWALRNRQWFPVDINTADLWLIKRVPGIGPATAQKIVETRRFGRLDWQQLKQMGAALNKACYFITGDNTLYKDYSSEQLKQRLLAQGHSKYQPAFSTQLHLF
jgi:putative DNA modification/repair radical SAM protein